MNLYRNVAARKLFGLCLALILSQGSTSHASEPADAPTTLAQVLGAIEDHHPQVRSLKANVRGAREGLHAVTAAYRPQVTLDGRIESSRRDATYQSGGRFEQTGTPRDIRLSLRQTLYNGGQRRLQRYSARLEADYAAARVEDAVISLQATALRDYVALCAAQDRIAILQDTAMLFTALLIATQARDRLGDSSAIEVAQVASRLAEAEAQLAQAQGLRATIAARLDSATGLAVVQAVLPARAAEVQELHLADLRAQTRETHPRAKVDALVLQVQRTALAAQARRNGATVTLLASATRADNYSPTIDQNDQVAVGLEWSLPLYSGGQYRSGLRQAHATVRAAQLSHADTYRSLDLMVQQDWLNLSALQRVKAARAHSLEAATQARAGVIEAQKAGFASTMDVLDATQSLLSARLNLSETEHEIAQTALTLRLHAGRLKTHAEPWF